MEYKDRILLNGNFTDSLHAQRRKEQVDKVIKKSHGDKQRNMTAFKRSTKVSAKVSDFHLA